MRKKLKKLENKGFTLVELIVVIAIMIVLLGVMSPALVQYIEESRADKDTSQMGEVTSALELTMANQNVYEDIVMYALESNYSCYADGNPETNIDANKVEDLDLTGTPGVVEPGDWWHYNDNARQLNQVAYQPSGNMSGITITFAHRGDAGYTNAMAINKGLVNNMTPATKKSNATIVERLSIDETTYLYNRLKTVVKDNVDTSSKKYRNSEYTVFIRVLPQNVDYDKYGDVTVQVYGQWNGMNLKKEERRDPDFETPGIDEIVPTPPTPTPPVPATPVNPLPDPTPQIPRDPATLTPPTAKDLTYNGNSQILINPGSSEDGTMYYKLPSGNWSVSLPAGTDADTYEVHYYVKGDSLHYDSPEYTLKVPIKKANPIVTKPQGKTLDYNGKAQELAFAGSAIGGTMYYKLTGGNFAPSVPTGKDPGEYTIHYYVKGNANYNDTQEATITSRIIGQATGVAPVAKDLTYNTKNQDLVNPGTATNGTMYYKLEGGQWSTTIPQGLNAGTYTVYWYVKGASIYYKDSAESTVIVNIKKASPSVTVRENSPLVYSGYAQQLIIKATSDSPGSFHWKVNSGSWSTTMPTGIDAGTYTVYYYVDETDNYFGYQSESNPASIPVTIGKSDPIYNVAGNMDLDYTGNAQNLIKTADVNSGGTIHYRLGTSGTFSTTQPKASNSGDYLIYYYIDATANYNGVGSETNFKSTPAKIKAVKASAPPEITGASWKYDGSARTVTTAKVTGWTIQYSTDNGATWSTTKPTRTNVGETTIKWKGTHSSFSEESGTVKLTCTPATPDFNAPVGKTLSYTGSAQVLATNGSTSHGTMYYSLSQTGPWSTSVPTGTNTGDYKVWYYVDGDANHNDTAPTYTPAKINLAQAILQPENKWLSMWYYTDTGSIMDLVENVRIVQSYTNTKNLPYIECGAEAFVTGYTSTNITDTVKTYWDASTKTAIIAGNGSGKIYLNGNATGTFYYLENCKSITGLENIDTSHATNMQWMFEFTGQKQKSFTASGMSNWDTSNVTDMHSMFLQSYDSVTENWNIGDISNWDTSSVTNMSGMFGYVGYKTTSNLTIDLSGWDTSNVTNMYQMFYRVGDCASNTVAITIKLDNFNVNKVTTFESMFEDLGFQANKITITGIDNWETKSAKTMESMFAGFGMMCPNISSIYLGNFDTSNVTNMCNMFGYSTCAVATNPFSGFENWNTSNVTNMERLFYWFGEDITNLQINLSNWDVSNVTTMRLMFDMFGFDSDSTNGVVDNSANDAKNYHTNCSVGDLSNWYTPNLTNTERMFERTALKKLNLKNMDTRNANTMMMFDHALFLEEITLGPNFKFNASTEYPSLDYKLIKPSSTYIPGAIGQWWDTTNLAWRTVDYLNTNGRTQAIKYVAVHDANMPILAPQNYWANIGGINVSAIEEIQIVDKYTGSYQSVYNAGVPTVNTLYTDSSSANSNVKIYKISNTKYIISGNGSGKIYLCNNASYTFRNLPNLKKITGLGLLDTSFTTNMYEMFYGAGQNSNTSFLLQGMENWDTSNVTNMAQMFTLAGQNATTWSIGNLSKWNTGSVTTMKSMFEFGYNANASNNYYNKHIYTTWSIGDISNWNTSNVTDMSSMFREAGAYTKSFNIGNIGKWDVSKVKTFASMFNDTAIESESFYIGDLSGWNVSSATDFSYMFDWTATSSNSFNIGNLGNWNVSNGTKFGCMFINAGFKATDWYIGDLSKWNVSNGTYFAGMFQAAGGSRTDSFYVGDLSNWNMSKATDISGMFAYSGQYASSWSVGDLGKWNVSNVTNMANLFLNAGYNARSWTPGNLNTWNVSKVTNMYAMFCDSGCEAATWNVGDLSSWNTANVTNMAFMFGYGMKDSDSKPLGAGEGLPKMKVFNVGNIGRWNVAKVTDMSYMFNWSGYHADEWYVGDLSNWNTGNVTNMSSMFRMAGNHARTWNVGTLKNWNVSKVTGMSNMFQQAEDRNPTLPAAEQINLDLSGWNVSNVQYMKAMFNGFAYNANKVSIGDISGWNVSNAIDMSYMMNGFGCNDHTWSLNLYNWTPNSCITHEEFDSKNQTQIVLPKPWDPGCSGNHHTYQVTDVTWNSSTSATVNIRCVRCGATVNSVSATVTQYEDTTGQCFNKYKKGLIKFTQNGYQYETYFTTTYEGDHNWDLTLDDFKENAPKVATVRGQCQTCNASFVETDCSISNWTVKQEATASAPGLATCQVYISTINQTINVSVTLPYVATHNWNITVTCVDTVNNPPQRANMRGECSCGETFLNTNCYVASWTVTKEPTETSDGLATCRIYSSTLGQYIDTTVILKRVNNVTSTPHCWDITVSNINLDAMTCTVKGTCTDCGLVFTETDTVITEWDIIKAPISTSAGEAACTVRIRYLNNEEVPIKVYLMTSHSHSYTIKITEHNSPNLNTTAPTLCSIQGLCRECGKTISESNCSITNWKIITPVTSTSDGLANCKITISTIGESMPIDIVLLH